MAYKTCPDCGSRMFEYGCVNCNEVDYITMQGANDSTPLSPSIEPVTKDEGKGLTAMGKLILWAQSHSPINPSNVITKAAELMELEREELINAFYEGQRKEARGDFWSKGAEYYQQKYSK